MEKSFIMAVRVAKRNKEAAKVQDTLTKHGCIISARLGLHEATGDNCSEDGLIILHIRGTAEQEKALKSDLDKVPGIMVKSMEI